MNETLVTVLMPCKNGAPGFLKEALESVFKQSIPTWKLIVIDDHSDNKEILAALGHLKIIEKNRYFYNPIFMLGHFARQSIEAVGQPFIVCVVKNEPV